MVVLEAGSVMRYLFFGPETSKTPGGGPRLPEGKIGVRGGSYLYRNPLAPLRCGFGHCGGEDGYST